LSRKAEISIADFDAADVELSTHTSRATGVAAPVQDRLL
jgi:hypothetical protein